MSLGLVESRFFIIDEKTEVTPFHLRNFNRVHEIAEENSVSKENLNKVIAIRRDTNNLKITNDNSRYIDSYSIVRILLEEKLVTPVTMSDAISLDMVLYKEVDVGLKKECLGDLNYTAKPCLQSLSEYNKKAEPRPVSQMAMRTNSKSKDSTKISGKRGEGKESDDRDNEIGKVLVFFADFGPFTVDNSGKALDKHIPFMCCASHNETERIECLKELIAENSSLTTLCQHLRHHHSKIGLPSYTSTTLATT